jgi:hypothetical protein
VSTVTASEWSVSVASCIGAHHVEREMPNQDSVRYVFAGPTAIVAVADGHGHHRHFRSARGSDLATMVALSETQRWLESMTALCSPEELSASALDNLAPNIWQAWRAAVAQDVEENPFSEGESMLRRTDDPPEIAYGATLLVAVVNAAHAILLQIGDGDILAVANDGRSWRPVPTDPVLFGNRTTSLAQTDAVKSFRAAVIDQSTDPLEVVLVGTDGFTNAQRDANWPDLVGADVARMRRDKGSGWLSRELPHWAQGCASRAGSGDDTTLALLVKEAPASAKAVGGAGRRSRRTARRVGVAAAIAAFAGVGIALGLSAGSRQAATGTSSSVTPPPTNSTPISSPTTVVATLPPTTSSSTTTTTTTTEIGSNHAKPLTIRANGVEAIDPASGRRVRVTFPAAVRTARPRQAIQIGKFVLVLAGRQLWRLRISAPRARPATTPLLASPRPPLGSSRGKAILPGRKGLVMYEVTPATMAVWCVPHSGLPLRVCAGAVSRR